MPTERVQYLVQRFFDYSATAAELQELATWVNEADNDDLALKESLQTAWQQHIPSTQMPDEMVTRLLDALYNHEKRPVLPIHRVHFIRRFGWWAAASLLLLVTAAFWLTRDQTRPSQREELFTNTIAPGTNGAILTLADGSVIVLDSLKNGLVTTQGNTSVNIENGQLVYNGPSDGPVVFNTMSTPKGRQFQLLLPDGSRVWLNAASTITYPTVFKGSQRTVKVSGEAYFEIAQNAKQPFQVQINNDMLVDVLGTSFNINAYGDEQNIKTALLQGSVKISNKRSGAAASAILKPGQQAILNDTDPRITIETIPEIEEVTAWKNGIFSFRKESLPKVMKQLERWYDIDVKYTGQLPEFTITGKMDRGLSLEELMDILLKMEVKYKLSGRTLTVLGN